MNNGRISDRLLYQNFITYYNNYEKNIEQEKVQKVSCFCLTLFGPFAAGKSTFLARLKSDLDAEEFYNTVINRHSVKMTIEDVTIGRGFTSTTIVPKLHRVGKNGEISIYDTGSAYNYYADTIANILHKCLLNHVKQNKFIVVLPLNVIEEERMYQLVDVYYDPLSALFGKNFRNKLSDMYFVITHFDKEKLSVKEIIAIIKERMISAIDVDKDQLARFLNRMLCKHITVDYREDTQEQLVYKLTELLSEKIAICPNVYETESELLTNEGHVIMQSGIAIDGLNVYENTLNKILQKDLEEYIRLIISNTEKYIEDLIKQRESLQLTINEMKIIKKKIDLAKREDLMAQQTEYEISIKEYEQKIAQQNASFNESLDKHIKCLNNVKHDELYGIGDTILKIFNKNKLLSSINEQMIQIDKYVEESISKLGTLKESVVKLLHMDYLTEEYSKNDYL